MGIVGLKIEKGGVIFEINTFKFVRTGFLTHIVNFRIGSTFSKYLSSAFSEGPGVNPIYKKYHQKHVNLGKKWRNDILSLTSKRHL